MAARVSELMGSASQQEVEIRQDAMTPSDAAHSMSLFYMLSLLTDGEALDIVQNSLVSCGMEVWRRMVTCWEPKVPSRFRKMGRRRDTVVNGLGKANARLRTADR